MKAILLTIICSTDYDLISAKDTRHLSILSSGASTCRKILMEFRSRHYLKSDLVVSIQQIRFVKRGPSNYR